MLQLAPEQPSCDTFTATRSMGQIVVKTVMLLDFNIVFACPHWQWSVGDTGSFTDDFCRHQTAFSQHDLSTKTKALNTTHDGVGHR